MTKDQFIDAFVSQFLANWCTDHYDVACMSGDHSRWDFMPVEDARDLAERAWKQYFLMKHPEFKDIGHPVSSNEGT